MLLILLLVGALSVQQVVSEACSFNHTMSKLVCDSFQPVFTLNTNITTRAVTLQILNATADALPQFVHTAWPKLEILSLENTENLDCIKLEKLKEYAFFHVVYNRQCLRKVETPCVLNFYNSLICTNLNEFPQIDESIKKRISFLDIIDSELKALPNFTAEGWSKLEFVTVRNVNGLSCDDIHRQKSTKLFFEHDLLCDSAKYFIPKPFQDKCSTLFSIVLQCILTTELPIIDSHAGDQIIFVDLKLSRVKNLSNDIHRLYPNTEYVTLVQTPGISCLEIHKLQELGVYVEHDHTCNANKTNDDDSSTAAEPLSLALTLEANDSSEALPSLEQFPINYTKTEFYQLIALLIICSFILVLKGKGELIKLLQNHQRRKRKIYDKRKSSSSQMYTTPAEQTDQ